MIPKLLTKLHCLNYDFLRLKDCKISNPIPLNPIHISLDNEPSSYYDYL